MRVIFNESIKQNLSIMLGSSIFKLGWSVKTENANIRSASYTEMLSRCLTITDFFLASFDHLRRLKHLPIPKKKKQKILSTFH